METTKPKKPRRYLRSRKTRKLILDNATELFIEEGYTKTTVEKIKDRTGIGYGTVFSHYRGKDVILSTIVDNIFYSFFDYQDRLETADNEEQLTDSYRELTLRLFKLALEHRHILKVYEGALVKSDNISTHWSCIIDSFTDNMSSSIAEHQSNEVMRDFDVLGVAKVFSLLLFSFFWEIVNEKEEDLESLSDTVVSVLFQGVAKQSQLVCSN